MSFDAGLIGKKLGMTSMWLDGVFTPVTAIEVPSNLIVDIKSYENKSSVVVAAYETKESKVNKPQRSIFKSISSPFLRKVKEFEVKNNDEFKVGQSIQINQSYVGMYINVSSVSKGKGFQGAMKRYGFAGMNASHGVSLTHRSLGSTGNRTEPGRVFKNKKMAGHMGNRNTTIKNLKIVSVDESLSILLVSGSVAGHKNSYVYLKSSKNI